MSFIHVMSVGHFDPRIVRRINLTCTREIDPARVEKLLAEYPAEVAEHVRLIDGYVECNYVGSRGTCYEAHEFAIRLAKEEGCLAIDNGINIVYPPEAVEIQVKALMEEQQRALEEEQRALEEEQRALEEWEKKHPSLKKIISGGRSGAERAALDTAIHTIFIHHGGWVPKGSIPEERDYNLDKPDKYKMLEMDTDSYSKCSEQNVIDSDGTLFVSYGKLTGRADFTRKMAIKHNKPWLHIDLNQTAKSPAVKKIADFWKQYRIEVLNVSGSLTSEDWKIYRAVRTLIERACYLQKYDRESGADSPMW